MPKKIMVFVFVAILLACLGSFLSKPEEHKPVITHVQKRDTDAVQKYKPEIEYDNKSFNGNTNNVKFSGEIGSNRKYLDEQFKNNYIDRTLTGGKLVRWNPATFPLKVYIEDIPDLPDYYAEQVKKAFILWQQSSGGLLSFVFTDIKDYADIRCFFPENFNTEQSENKMVTGTTRFTYKNDLINYAQIDFARYVSGSKYFSKNGIYSTAVHEAGHALGLGGHSVNPDDVMYPVSSNYHTRLSTGDLSTLKLLYSIVPDVSNKDFSQKQKETFLTSYDVFGNKDTRVDIELESTKADIDATGFDVSSKTIRTANLYYKKKDYNSAVANYKKSLTLLADKSQIEIVSMRIAFCYYYLKDYNNALTYANKSEELKHDNEKLSFITVLYYETGNLKEAKQLAESLINSSPSDKKIYNVYMVLHNIYLKEKNYEAIDKLYNLGITNFPSNPPLRKK